MQEVYDFANEKMTKSVKSLHNEYVSMRAGKASVSLLDKVVVDYYGCPTPVQQMAAVSVSEGRNLVIQPWDVSTINAIEKAIQASDLGVNPMNDGKVIRLNFPPLFSISQVYKRCAHKHALFQPLWPTVPFRVDHLQLSYF